MTYFEWFEAHGKKHRDIVRKLSARGLDKDAIIDYFDFDNMRKHESDFCRLYKTQTKCHEMKALNCYLCACPEFRFNDKGLQKQGTYLIKSACSLNNGSTLGHQNIIHQDCSKCTTPHHRSYVEKYFNLDWREMMHACHTPQEGYEP